MGIILKKYNKERLKDRKGFKLFARNTAMSLLLAGALSSATVGCKKNTIDESNKTTYEQIDYDMNSLKSKLEEEYYIDQTGHEAAIAKLKEQGLSVTYIGTIDEEEVYLIDEVDINKMGANEYFDRSIKFTKNISNLKMDVTYDDLREVVNNLDLNKDYKNILMESIEKLEKKNKKSVLPFLYYNLSNSSFEIDKNMPTSQFSYIEHKFMFGDVIYDKSELKPEYERAYRLGIISKEDYEKIKIQGAYITDHEEGHAGNEYYNETTGEAMNSEGNVVIINPKTGELRYSSIGISLAEGFADYFAYDITNIKANKYYGYVANQCYYLAFKEMLGLDAEEITTLNVKEVISKLQKLGIYNPAKYIDAADNDVYASMYATSLVSKGKSIDSMSYDYTFSFLEFFTDYMYSRYSSGESLESIEATMNRILDLYEERLEVEKDSGIIYGIAGYSTIDVGSLRKMIPIIIRELDVEAVGLETPKQYVLKQKTYNVNI